MTEKSWYTECLRKQKNMQNNVEKKIWDLGSNIESFVVITSEINNMLMIFNHGIICYGIIINYSLVCIV